MAAVAQAEQSSPRLITIGYWVSTALFALAMTGSGIGMLMRAEPVMASTLGIGYPEYIATILGVSKLLGVVALLYPGFPRLKEWAYAGFTFNLVGAFVSHLLAGDPLVASVVPLAPWLLMVVSYLFYSLRLR